MSAASAIARLDIDAGVWSSFSAKIARTVAEEFNSMSAAFKLVVKVEGHLGNLSAIFEKAILIRQNIQLNYLSCEFEVLLGDRDYSTIECVSQLRIGTAISVQTPAGIVIERKVIRAGKTYYIPPRPILPRPILPRPPRQVIAPKPNPLLPQYLPQAPLYTNSGSKKVVHQGGGDIDVEMKFAESGVSDKAYL